MIVNYEYGEILLSINGVNVQYDGRQILREVCAEVRKVKVTGRTTGQIIALLGPSGRGKSTLFRVIAGLEKPKSGNVMLLEEGKLNPVKTGDVGVVAQNYPLFAHRTVMGNLLLAAKAHETDARKAESTVMEGLVNFGLSDKGSLYPCQLSGGQRQRVSILQMLICKEPFILMDEPFASLDLINIEIACETISHAANLSGNNTFIIVTHDVTAAVSIADHIWMLGFERDEKGNPFPGARIVKTYDLLERGLCYEPGVMTSPTISSTVREIKEEFRKL